jgi:adenylate kinase
MIDSARLLVLGRQGAGKGTQCERLARQLAVPHISSGDVLRAAVRTSTDLGRAAQRSMIAGDLVPDSLVVAAVAERLEQPDTGRGFVLDGFPRTRAQARTLFDLLHPMEIDAAVDIEVPADIVVRRLAARRVCESCGKISVATACEPSIRCRSCGHQAVQRADDTPAAIARRLAIYESETRPLLDWLAARGQLLVVDGVGSPDDVERRVIEAIEPVLTPGMLEAG